MRLCCASAPQFFDCTCMTTTGFEPQASGEFFLFYSPSFFLAFCFSFNSSFNFLQSTVRGLTKFKTRGRLLGLRWLTSTCGLDHPDIELDEKMSIFSSTPQDHGRYTNSSWLESGLKVRKCHAMPLLRTCMSQKWT